MAKTNFKSVPAYIASRPRVVQPILRRLRAIIRKAVPTADEVISYQIPAYKIDGATVLFFAGWQEHYSIYPATDGIVEAFKAALVPYEVSKGTIRFPLSEPIPVKLIARIATFRAKVAAERAAARRPKKR